MSPIRLADYDSDSDSSDGLNENENQGVYNSPDSTCESTYPRIDGEWAIGDEVNEPVAIVGIGTLTYPPLIKEKILTNEKGCRLPGGVKSAADLWDMLKEERSGHSKVPKERWNIDAFHHENGIDKIGSMSMVSGFLLVNLIAVSACEARVLKV